MKYSKRGIFDAKCIQALKELLSLINIAKLNNNFYVIILFVTSISNEHIERDIFSVNNFNSFMNHWINLPRRLIFHKEVSRVERTAHRTARITTCLFEDQCTNDSAVPLIIMFRRNTKQIIFKFTEYSNRDIWNILK